MTAPSKKILIFHAGGTIGMVSENDGSKALKPGQIGNHFLELVPQLNQIARVEVKVLDNMDSSNVTPAHWVRWMTELQKIYGDYDGFVFTHGTDSMAYTGAAFSFALERTEKPIVFTGSQRPLDRVRTDARDNLINAVEIAVRGPKEVSLCFGNELLRANRATKLSATDYIAFESFNFPHLARVGVNIDRRWENLAAGDVVPEGAPQWNLKFNQNIFCFKIFPGISGDILLDTVGARSCEGVVLEAFGAGNVPDYDDRVLAMIRRATELGKPVVIVSQCPHGNVDLELYALGVQAKKAGAIGAGDMTREACVVKLMHALGRGLKGAELTKYFSQNVCGERSR